LVEHLEGEGESPLLGRAGHRLTRLLEWSGSNRSEFDIITTTELSQYPDRVYVALGNAASEYLIHRGNILFNRGYVWPSQWGHVIPTIHPSFIVGGQAKWSAAFINDVRKATDLARTGLPPEFTDYLLDPLPGEAYRWALQYRDRLQQDPSIRLAFDIETPGKGEDEDDVELGDAPDRTWHIDRIGFSYEPLTALSIPWNAAYMATIRILMESEGDKVVWNAGFDVPRIRRADVGVHGLVHDGMVAWHILHSDLPKRLGFVATFTCPWQPAWKHLSGARPAFYNATDADVEARAMSHIDAELRRTNLWDVYQRDVIELEPVLLHIHQRGMPIDAQIRLDRAIKLDERIREIHSKMEACVPIGARKIEHVYKRPPAGDQSNLLARPGSCSETFCTNCGMSKPPKAHFKSFKRKHNECAGGETASREVECVEYYRLKEFTPSRDQLTSYHRVLKRPLPMVWDQKKRERKVSFGEEQLKQLLLKYPDDLLYPLILDYRAADKLAGTYVGRPAE
jgi:hypothetical protein